MTLQIVTANYLKNGRVVFLTSIGNWSEAIADSYVASKDDLNALIDRIQNKGKALTVVEPYLIEVETTDGEIWPIRYREQIRAFGPSIHPDFCKQRKPNDIDVRHDLSAIRDHDA